MNKIIIPRPDLKTFDWFYRRPPNKYDMERHLRVHLSPNFLMYGVPLYDLETCAVKNIRLPELENDLAVELKQSPEITCGEGSRAARTLTTGAYLGVFSTLHLNLLPIEFEADPRGHNLDTTFVEDVYSHSSLTGGEYQRIPYDNATVKNLLRDDFLPFGIEIDTTV